MFLFQVRWIYFIALCLGIHFIVGCVIKERKLRQEYSSGPPVEGVDRKDEWFTPSSASAHGTSTSLYYRTDDEAIKQRKEKVIMNEMMIRQNRQE